MTGSNTGAAKREYIDRYIRILEEIDALNDDKRDLEKEIKGRADALGFTPKEIRDAVNLKRKGVKETVSKIQAALNTLRDAQLEDAIDEAFR